jgi:hypothetical protein
MFHSEMCLIEIGEYQTSWSEIQASLWEVSYKVSLVRGTMT